VKHISEGKTNLSFFPWALSEFWKANFVKGRIFT